MTTPSMYVLSPVTEAGKTWLEDNLQDAIRFGHGYAVEWRYLDAIVEGMKEAGLSRADVEIIY